MAFDAHANFGYATIATAPTPAASGTTLSVTAGYGTRFPAAPFNAVVWPAGANPLIDNAEVVRVTNKGTGDNWTVTRAQEPQTGSISRSIAIGDQIMCAVTAKTVTDVETLVTANGVSITTNTADIATAIKGLVPGGRLTLTTALPVTTADVTGASAGTVYYTPYIHNQVPLYDGVSAWVRRTFAEISIAVPAVASQMYDVFVYDNAGTATLELLAWTNDTTRATALVKQDGRWVKTGATTRFYLGSFRTTTVVSQTEDSYAKRFVWNFYNRVSRSMRLLTSGSWTYTTATYRQANASTTNQLAVVVGVAEEAIDISLVMFGANSSVNIRRFAAIGEDSTTTPATGALGFVASGVDNAPANSLYRMDATLKTIPAVGYHFYSMLERSEATGTCTWGDVGALGVTLVQPGIAGTWRA